VGKSRIYFFGAYVFCSFSMTYFKCDMRPVPCVLLAWALGAHLYDRILASG
jgi:hypothetical protein